MGRALASDVNLSTLPVKFRLGNAAAIDEPAGVGEAVAEHGRDEGDGVWFSLLGEASRTLSSDTETRVLEPTPFLGTSRVANL